MFDVESPDEAALLGQLAQAGASDVDAHHPDILRDRQQQRTGLLVGVARPQQRIDLQGDAVGVRKVQRDAVVDHALEHRLGQDPHGLSMAEVDRMSDDDKLAEYAQQLADAIDGAVGSWIVRCVEQRLRAWQGGSDVDARVLAEARAAGEQARAELGPQLRKLLATDIDEQRLTPLTLLRRAVRYPTEVLRAAGVPPVVRDEFVERAFPDDVYDLSPATFADIDPALHEPGLVWGAAKAHVHLSRRKAGRVRGDSPGSEGKR